MCAHKQIYLSYIHISRVYLAYAETFTFQNALTWYRTPSFCTLSLLLTIHAIVYRSASSPVRVTIGFDVSLITVTASVSWKYSASASSAKRSCDR